MRMKIPHTVYEKVMYWVNRADFEVSGFGKVTYDPSDNSYTVTDAFLLKQEGGAAHTDIDPASLGKLMFESKDAPGDLNWWWHSHVKMAAFWSQTDKDTIMSIGKKGYCVATVFNQREETKSAYYGMFTGPKGESFPFEKWDAELEVLERPAKTYPPEWEQAFKDHVTEAKEAAWDHWLPATSGRAKTWDYSTYRKSADRDYKLYGYDTSNGRPREYHNGVTSEYDEAGKLYCSYRYNDDGSRRWIKEPPKLTKKQKKNARKSVIRDLLIGGTDDEETDDLAQRASQIETYSGLAIAEEARMTRRSIEEVIEVYERNDQDELMELTTDIEASIGTDYQGYNT